MSTAEPTRVRVEPLGLVLIVPEGGTMFAAATGAGVRWPNVCGGYAQCRTCWFRILEGEAAFEPAAPLEAAALVLVAPTLEDAAAVRLACQARLRPGAVAVVRKIGVRPAPPKET